MCAMLIGVFGGNPVSVTTNVALPPVMVLFASRVTSNVMVAVPLPVDSASVTGGFSFDGFRSAVNVGFVGDADVGELLLHPTAARASANVTRDNRFMRPTPSCN